MSAVKDGWHKVYGYDVYVEDGKVKRATIGEGVSYRPAAIWERCPGGGADNVNGYYTLDQVRDRMRRGKIGIR